MMYYQFQNPILHINRFLAWSFIQSVHQDLFLQNLLASELDRVPDLTISFLHNSNDSNISKLNKILQLFTKDHNFFGILGSVGSGKTSLAYFFLEQVAKFRSVYWVGDMNPNKVPKFAKHIQFNLKIKKQLKEKGLTIFDELPEGCVAYFDELSHIFPKGSLTPEEIEDLSIYRHRNQVIMGSTQNSSIISIDVIRFFTGIFVLQTTLFHTENERDNPFITALRLFKPTTFGQCTFYSAVLQEEFFLRFNYSLPENYDEIAGKSFS